MNIIHTYNWLSADVQACIDPPSITLIKVEIEYEQAKNIIKVGMLSNPAIDASETYKLKMSTFDNG